MRKMKRIILMLAFCGAMATMTAQTGTESDRKYPGGKGTQEGKTKTEMKSKKKMAGDKSKSEPGMTVTYTQTPVQEDKESVPEKVKEAFKTAYQNAKASWKREGENFRARFQNDKDALHTIVVYDKEGNMLVTEREISNTSCPDIIEKYCSRDTRVWEVETKDAPLKYFIQEEDEEIRWYDSMGNPIFGESMDTHGVGVIYKK